MRNIKLRIEDGHILHIEIDLDGRGLPSRSGRSASVASTEGNIHLLDGQGGYREEVLNCNVYRPVPPGEAT